MWGFFTFQEIVHLVPLRDKLGHTLTDKCRCKPDYSFFERIYHHNSFDKREYFESPPRKKTIVN